MKTKKVGGNNIFLTVVLILGCLTVFFPLYMTIIIAFKQPSEMTNSISGALSLPKQFSFDNFKEAYKYIFKISLEKEVYLLIENDLPDKKKSYKLIYFYIVSGMFVPFAILMMPLVKQTSEMGLSNKLGVIILYLVFYMPMNVMLYSGYLKNIPLSLEEASEIDGASTWKTYWTIIFPMMKPMHATVAILTALGTWNDTMTPLVILSDVNDTTLPLAQLNFQTQFGANYNLAFASYLLALIPLLIFYIICQKQIIGGVANGAVKG